MTAYSTHLKWANARTGGRQATNLRHELAIVPDEVTRITGYYLPITQAALLQAATNELSSSEHRIMPIKMIDYCVKNVVWRELDM